jgi:hypothetical protein
MKKLLFVLAFAFIGQQAFSQMYIVTMSMVSNTHPSCNNYYVMTTVDPQGNITYDCMGGNRNVSDGAQNLVDINLNFNSIISQGYKLIHIVGQDQTTDEFFGSWYFAIP